jgi:hypothetical protein
MTKQQLREFLKIINDCGLSWKNEFQITNKTELATFRYNNSQLEFVAHAGNSLSNFKYTYVRYNLIFDLIKKDQQSVVTHELQTAFKGWLQRHVLPYKAELDEPDPLLEGEEQGMSEESKSKSAFQTISDNDTTKFNEAEIKLLIASIDRVEEQIYSNFDVKPEVAESVKAELNYAKEATKTLNKRDWKAVTQKVMYDVGISVTANVTVDAARAAMNVSISQTFWNLVIEGFKVVLSLSTS